MQLILISGLSGSGKSIALNVLEDAGFFCVDNLPAPLLNHLVDQLNNDGYTQVAVAMDMRGGARIADLPIQLKQLHAKATEVRFIFLDARNDILTQRFSETRRRHPLANANTTLPEAIRAEREALENIASLGHHIDTSNLRPNALRVFIREFLGLEGTQSQLKEAPITLLFESFGFKHGIPLDADLVFDIRCLPNPHYDPQLRPFTGQDAAIINFLAAQPEVSQMFEDIRRFVHTWLPAYIRDSRSYLTVAIGCTGGQHRSVYLAEQLAKDFHDQAHVLIRHRALGA